VAPTGSVVVRADAALTLVQRFSVTARIDVLLPECSLACTSPPNIQARFPVSAPHPANVFDELNLKTNHQSTGCPFAKSGCGTSSADHASLVVTRKSRQRDQAGEDNWRLPRCIEPRSEPLASHRLPLKIPSFLCRSLKMPPPDVSVAPSLIMDLAYLWLVPLRRAPPPGSDQAAAGWA